MTANTANRTSPTLTARAAACGKAIIVGEHFVVWGSTALAIPVRQARLEVALTAIPRQRNRAAVSGPQADQRTLLAARKGVRELLTGQRYSVTAGVRSNFPAGAGLGASAAFCVAFARSLLKLPQVPGTEDDVAQAAHAMERVFHAYPSGIDSTTIAFENPCFVKTGEHFAVPGPKPASGPMAGFLQIAPGAVFILADTGERRSTADVVDRVATFMSQPRGEAMFGKFMGVAESIVLQTAAALKDGDFEFVGHMMKENHYLLQALELSTEALERLRRTALEAGALGAKMTGAGLGGFVMALAWPDDVENVVSALRAAGAGIVFTQSA